MAHRPWLMARPLTICHQRLAISHFTGVGAIPPARPDRHHAAAPVPALDGQPVRTAAVARPAVAQAERPQVRPPAGLVPEEPCAEPPYHRPLAKTPEAGLAAARSRVDPCVECDNHSAHDSPEPLVRTAALPRVASQVPRPALRPPVDLALGAASRHRNASGRPADSATSAGQSSADQMRLRAVPPEPDGSLPDADAVATFPVSAGAPRCRRRRRRGRCRSAAAVSVRTPMAASCGR